MWIWRETGAWRRRERGLKEGGGSVEKPERVCMCGDNEAKVSTYIFTSGPDRSEGMGGYRLRKRTAGSVDGKCMRMKSR